MKLKFLHHSSVLRQKTSALSRIGRDPYIDWALLVSLAFVISVALVIAGLSSYLGLTGQKPGSAGASFAREALPSLDTGSLGVLIGHFDAASQERAALSGAYHGPTDPSL